MFTKIIATTAMCISLCACETMRFWSSNDGCRAVYQATADAIVLKGVKLPLNAAGNLNLDIGEWGLTPKELSDVTEAVRIAQESRLRQCNVLRAMERATPPASADQIARLSATFHDADHATNLLIGILSDRNRTKELPAAALALRDAARAEPKKFDRAREGGDSATSIIEEIKRSLPDYSTRLNDLAVADKLLNEQLAALRASTPELVRIEVTGFRPGSAALRPEMRRSLEADLQTAISRRSRRGPVSVSITGYADATGSSLQNLGVGMQRASAVASHIHLVFADRIDIRSISSGGVKFNDPEARRVEVTVSKSLVANAVVAA